jgi:hypothetical protein
MAEQASQPFELVEVKAEDLMEERSALYDRFMTASTWGIALTVVTLALMWIFLV